MENRNIVFNANPPIQQFISCEDKAMNFYEELLRNEEDSEVRKELVKAYSQLIIKRIELNLEFSKSNSKYNLDQLKYNAEICKLDRQIQLESIKKRT